MIGTDTADIRTTNIYIVKASIKIVKWITPTSVAMAFTQNIQVAKFAQKLRQAVCPSLCVSSPTLLGLLCLLNSATLLLPR